MPDAGDDATSLPPPDGVAGALAWLSRRPGRSEQPLVPWPSLALGACSVVAMVTRFPVWSKTLKDSFSRRTRHFRRTDDDRLGKSASCRLLRRVPSSLRHGSLRPAQDGAEDTEERVFTLMVYDMVFPITSSTIIVESIALFSLSTSLGWFLGAVDDDVFPRQAMGSNAFLFLCRPAVGWFPGEVGAFDSHEQSRSGLRKSP